MDYLYILLAVIGIAVQFSCIKWYQARTVTATMNTSTAAAKCFFLAMTRSLFCILIFFTLLRANHIEWAVSAFSLRAAVIMAGLATGIGLTGVLALSRGTVSTYTLFMMLGGMMLPFLVGVIFWGEDLTAFRLAGLILLTVSLYAPIMDSKKTRSPYIFLFLCFCIFMLNGGTSIVSKYHQAGSERVHELNFVLLAEMISAPVNAVLWLLFRPRRGQGDERRGRLGVVGVNISIIALYALASGLAYLLLLRAAVNLDASILYPLVTGGTIITAAAAGYIFFREKPGKYSAAGIAIAVFATILFIIG